MQSRFLIGGTPSPRGWPSAVQQQASMSVDESDSDQLRTDAGLAWRAQLFPGCGFPVRDGRRWRLVVQGRLFRTTRLPLATRILLRGLQRSLRVEQELLASPEFRDRVEGFLVAGQARQRVHLEIAGQRVRLKRRTGTHGLFQGKIDLPGDLIDRQVTSVSDRLGTDLSLEVRWLDIHGRHAPAASQAFLLQPRGCSVISDIDDTIKLTGVTNRKQLLANTFLHPFRPVLGMAQLYQHWADQGAAFHYVSSSPWQLFQPLWTLLQDSQFPAGSMHLRWFRLRDEMFKSWRIVRRKGKAGVIRSLIRRSPNRRFVLVGDSGERDPELYAEAAKRYPQQVRLVLIRELEERPLDMHRLRRLRRLLGHVPLVCFTDSEQVRECLREHRLVDHHEPFG